MVQTIPDNSVNSSQLFLECSFYLVLPQNCRVEARVVTRFGNPTQTDRIS